MPIDTLTQFLPDFLDGKSAWALLGLRLIWGIALMVNGLPMIRHPRHWMDLGGKPSGFPGLLQAIGALAVFGGGLAITYGRLRQRGGLFDSTRCVEFSCSNGSGTNTASSTMSKPEESQALLEDVVKAFGKVDILVSNAGIEHFGKLEEITKEDFDRMFLTNVAGQLFVTQAAVRYLPSGGRIVLTSSVSAKISVFHHTLYAASKAAVSAMVLNLAPELGERGITINAIAPGGTATDMATENGKLYTHPALKDVSPEALRRSKTSLQRLAQPEEIASAVTFLVSDDASYITGSTLAVDGGRL